MGKIDAHNLRIKMMASYLHYLVTNRCTKAFIFDEIWNLNFPPKTNKSILMTSQDFFFRFPYWPPGLVVKSLACHPGDPGSIPLGGNFFSHFFFLNFILCIKNQLYSSFWWHKPRSVERIWILLIFSLLFA